MLLSPAWLLALVFIPKLRAGFWQKCGFLKTASLSTAKGRCDLNFATRSALENKPLIVIHAVSVGEFNAAKPVIEWLQSLPDYQVLVTNTTRTGHELAAAAFPALPCVYFPFDFPWVLHHWFKRLQPQAVFLMETEIWPGFVFMAKAYGAKLVMMNGRLSERSYTRYRVFKGFLKGVLAQYDALWMQSEQDKKHILDLGAPPERTSVLGNLKFHVPSSSAEEIQTDLKAFLTQSWQDKPIVVFASTHEGEEVLFLEVYHTLKQNFPDLKAVFVPRHPERFELVYRLLAASGFVLARRSEPKSLSERAINVLLLDSMGELTLILPFITIACVGGSFVPVGGHNFLESLQFGVPTLVGPYMSNFTAITQQALSKKAIIQIDNSKVLLENLKILLNSAQQRENLKTAGQKFLSSQQHVLQAYQDAILAILKTD